MEDETHNKAETVKFRCEEQRVLFRDLYTFFKKTFLGFENMVPVRCRLIACRLSVLSACLVLDECQLGARIMNL